jgi:hypothetical protein
MHPRLQLVSESDISKHSGSDNECAESGSGNNNISGPDISGSEMTDKLIKLTISHQCTVKRHELKVGFGLEKNVTAVKKHCECGSTKLMIEVENGPGLIKTFLDSLYPCLTNRQKDMDAFNSNQNQTSLFAYRVPYRYPHLRKEIKKT